MNIKECKDQWALVTGASSGIGMEFCQHLAKLGLNLVMVARNTEILQQLQTNLTRTHGVSCLTIPVDLSTPDAVSTIRKETSSQGIKIRLLCNNAAFGHWGKFEDAPEDMYSKMITVNASVMVALCYAYLSDLASHTTSAIINVSSPAALQPVPYMAVYAATKSFVHHFSQALYGEWHERGILVQTLVPGPTTTDFDKRAGAYESAIKERGTPEEVVLAALKHLDNDQPLAVTAKGIYKQRIFGALFPPKMVINTVAKMFRPPSTGSRGS